LFSLARFARPFSSPATTYEAATDSLATCAYSDAPGPTGFQMFVLCGGAKQWSLPLFLRGFILLRPGVPLPFFQVGFFFFLFWPPHSFQECAEEGSPAAVSLRERDAAVRLPSGIFQMKRGVFSSRTKIAPEREAPPFNSQHSLHTSARSFPIALPPVSAGFLRFLQRGTFFWRGPSPIPAK